VRPLINASLSNGLPRSALFPGRPHLSDEGPATATPTRLPAQASKNSSASRASPSPSTDRGSRPGADAGSSDPASAALSGSHRPRPRFPHVAGREIIRRRRVNSLCRGMAPDPERGKARGGHASAMVTVLEQSKTTPGATGSQLRECCTFGICRECPHRSVCRGGSRWVHPRNRP
jgi:hypothetical protein